MVFLNPLWFYLIVLCAFLVTMHGSHLSAKPSDMDHSRLERYPSLQKPFGYGHGINHSTLNVHIVSNSHHMKHREACLIGQSFRKNGSLARTENDTPLSFLKHFSFIAEHDSVAPPNSNVSRMFQTIGGLLIQLKNIAKMRDESMNQNHAKGMWQSRTMFKEATFSWMNESRVTGNSPPDSIEDMVRFVEGVSSIFSETGKAGHNLKEVDHQIVAGVMRSFMQMFLNSNECVESPLVRTMEFWSEFLVNSSFTTEHNVKNFIEKEKHFSRLKTKKTEEEDNLFKYVTNQLQRLMPKTPLTDHMTYKTSSVDDVLESVGIKNSSGVMKLEKPDILSLIKLFNSNDSEYLLDSFTKETFMELAGKYENAIDHQDFLFLQTLSSFIHLLKFEASYEFLSTFANTTGETFLNDAHGNQTFNLLKIKNFLKLENSSSHKRPEQSEVYLMQMVKETLSTLSDDVLPRYVLSCLFKLFAHGEAGISGRDMTNTSREGLRKNETEPEPEYLTKGGPFVTAMNDPMKIAEGGSVLLHELRKIVKSMYLTLDAKRELETAKNVRKREQLMEPFDSIVWNQTFPKVASKQNVTLTHPKNLLSQTLMNKTYDFTEKGKGNSFHDDKGAFSKSFGNMLHNFLKHSSSNTSIISERLSKLEDLVSQFQPMEMKFSKRGNKLAEHMFLELTNLIILDGTSDLLSKVQKLWRAKFERAEEDHFNFDRKSQVYGIYYASLEIGRIKDALSILKEARLQKSFLSNLSDVWHFQILRRQNEDRRNSSDKWKMCGDEKFSKSSKNVSVEFPNKGSDLNDADSFSHLNRCVSKTENEMIHYFVRHMIYTKGNVNSSGEWDALISLERTVNLSSKPLDDSNAIHNFVEEATELFSKLMLCSKCSSEERNKRSISTDFRGDDPMTGNMEQVSAVSLNMSSTQNPSKPMNGDVNSSKISIESTLELQEPSTEEVNETFHNLSPILTTSFPNSITKHADISNDVFDEESERHPSQPDALYALSKIPEEFLGTDSNLDLQQNIAAIFLLSNISQTTEDVRDEYWWSLLPKLNRTLRLLDSLLKANREAVNKLVTALPEVVTALPEVVTALQVNSTGVEKRLFHVDMQIADHGEEMAVKVQNVSTLFFPTVLLPNTSSKNQPKTSTPFYPLSNLLSDKFVTVNGTQWGEKLVQTTEEKANDVNVSPDDLHQRLLSAVMDISTQTNKTIPGIEMAETIEKIISSLELFPMLADYKTENLFDEFSLNETNMSGTKPVEQGMAVILETKSPEVRTTEIIPAKNDEKVTAELFEAVTEPKLDLKEIPSLEATETSIHSPTSRSTSSSLNFGDDEFGEETDGRHGETAVLFALKQIAEAVLNSDFESDLSKGTWALELLRSISESKKGKMKYPRLQLVILNETLQLTDSLSSTNTQMVPEIAEGLPEYANVSESQLELSEVMNIVKQVNSPKFSIGSIKEFEEAMKDLISRVQLNSTFAASTVHKIEELLNDLERMGKFTEAKQVEQEVATTLTNINKISYTPSKEIVTGNTENVVILTEMSRNLQELLNILKRVNETKPGRDFEEAMKNLTSVVELNETFAANTVHEIEELLNDLVRMGKFNEAKQVEQEVTTKFTNINEISYTPSKKIVTGNTENVVISTERSKNLQELLNILKQAYDETKPDKYFKEAMRNLTSTVEMNPTFAANTVHVIEELLNDLVRMGKFTEAKQVEREVTTTFTNINEIRHTPSKEIVAGNTENVVITTEMSRNLLEALNILKRINETKPGRNIEEAMKNLTSIVELNETFAANIVHEIEKLLNDLVRMGKFIKGEQGVQEVSTTFTNINEISYTPSNEIVAGNTENVISREMSKSLQEALDILKRVNETKPGRNIVEAMKNLNSIVELNETFAANTVHEIEELLNDLVRMGKFIEAKQVEQEVTTKFTNINEISYTPSKKIVTGNTENVVISTEMSKNLQELLNILKQAYDETKPDKYFEEVMKNLTSIVELNETFAANTVHVIEELLNDLVRMGKFTEAKQVEQEVTTTFTNINEIRHTPSKEIVAGNTENVVITTEMSRSLQKALNILKRINETKPGKNIEEAMKNLTSIVELNETFAAYTVHEIKELLIDLVRMGNLTEAQQVEQEVTTMFTNINEISYTPPKETGTGNMENVVITTEMSKNLQKALSFLKRFNETKPGSQLEEAMKNLTSIVELHKTFAANTVHEMEEILNDLVKMETFTEGKQVEQEVTTMLTNINEIIYTSSKETGTGNTENVITSTEISKNLQEALSILKRINETKPGKDFEETMKYLNLIVELNPTFVANTVHEMEELLNDLVRLGKFTEGKQVEQEVTTTFTNINEISYTPSKEIVTGNTENVVITTEMSRNLQGALDILQRINETKSGRDFEDAMKNLTSIVELNETFAANTVHEMEEVLNDILRMGKFTEGKQVEQEVTTTFTNINEISYTPAKEIVTSNTENVVITTEMSKNLQKALSIVKQANDVTKPGKEFEKAKKNLSSIVQLNETFAVNTVREIEELLNDLARMGKFTKGKQVEQEDSKTFKNTNEIGFGQDVFAKESERHREEAAVLSALKDVEEKIINSDFGSGLAETTLGLALLNNMNQTRQRQMKKYHWSQLKNLNDLTNEAVTAVSVEESTLKELQLTEPETTGVQTEWTTPATTLNTLRAAATTKMTPRMMQPTRTHALNPVQPFVKETSTESIPHTEMNVFNPLVTKKLANYTEELKDFYQHIRSENTTTSLPYIIQSTKPIQMKVESTELTHNLSPWNVELIPTTKLASGTGIEKSSVLKTMPTFQRRTEGPTTTPPNNLGATGRSNISSSLANIFMEHVEEEAQLINEIKQSEGRAKDMFKNISESIRELTSMVHELLDLKTNLKDFISMEKEQIVLESHVTSKHLDTSEWLREGTTLQGKGGKVNETRVSLISSKYRLPEGSGHALEMSSMIEFIKETFDNLETSRRNKTYLANAADKFGKENINVMDVLARTSLNEENRNLLEFLVTSNISFHRAANLFQWLELFETFGDQQLNVSMSKAVLKSLMSLLKDRPLMRQRLNDILKNAPNVNSMINLLKKNFVHVIGKPRNETYLADIYQTSKFKNWISDGESDNVTFIVMDFLSMVIATEENRRLLDFLIDSHVSLHQATQLYDWLKLWDELEQRLNVTMKTKLLNRVTSLLKEVTFMKDKLHEISKYGPDLRLIIAFIRETYENIAIHSQDETYLPDIRETENLQKLVDEAENKENTKFNVIDLLSRISANGENQRFLDMLFGSNISLDKMSELYNWLRLLDTFTNYETTVRFFTNITQEGQPLNVSTSKNILNRIKPLSKERNFMKNLLTDLFEEESMDQNTANTSIGTSVIEKQQNRLLEHSKFIERLLQTEDLLWQQILSSEKFTEDVEKMRKLMNLKGNMTLWQWVEMMSNFFNRSLLETESGKDELHRHTFKGKEHGQLKAAGVPSTTPVSPETAKPHPPSTSPQVTTEGTLFKGRPKAKTYTTSRMWESQHTAHFRSMNGPSTSYRTSSIPNETSPGHETKTSATNEKIDQEETPTTNTFPHYHKMEPSTPSPSTIPESATRSMENQRRTTKRHFFPGRPIISLGRSTYRTGTIAHPLENTNTPENSPESEEPTLSPIYQVLSSDVALKEEEAKITNVLNVDATTTTTNTNREELGIPTPSVFSSHGMESSTPLSNIKPTVTPNTESQIRISYESFSRGGPSAVLTSSTVQSIIPWAQWSSWSSWGQCTVTCGQGRKVRRRECQMDMEGAIIPAESCFGFSEEGMTCEVIPCRDTMPPQVQPPIVPKWTDWSEWGRCSVSCGHGKRTRSRECKPNNSAESCVGNSMEIDRCFLQSCPDVNKQPISINKGTTQELPENKQRKPAEDTNRPRKHHATLSPGTISAIVAASILLLLMIAACTVAHSKRLLRKAQRRADVNDFI